VLYAAHAEAPGLNTTVRLNLQPSWIIVPPALRGTTLELLGSTSNPASSNAGVVNIWQNGLRPVIDVELSTAAGGGNGVYYTATDWRDCEHIEYAYLRGMNGPAFDSAQDFKRLGIMFRVYIAFATKAIDWRGLQRVES